MCHCKIGQVNICNLKFCIKDLRGKEWAWCTKIKLWNLKYVSPLIALKSWLRIQEFV